MKLKYVVCAGPGLRYDALAEENLELSPGDEVVVAFEKYEDCGSVLRAYGAADEQAAEREEQSNRRGGRRGTPGEAVGNVVRKMTPADKAKAEENEGRGVSMFQTGQRKIREHNLKMKLVSCHYSFDRRLVIFQFTADGRVDFRDLVRDLSGALHLRVELRQIGVRDEAGILGGIGVCGRPFCCATVLENFHSVNVKMAKVQRLSLNPSSVSGGCGRLKCCLRYEVKGYEEMFRNLPRNGSRCMTPEGLGRVLDCNALTQRVRVRLMGEGDVQILDFPVAEIELQPRDGQNEQDYDPRQNGGRGEEPRRGGTDDVESVPEDGGRGGPERGEERSADEGAERSPERGPDGGGRRGGEHGRGRGPRRPAGGGQGRREMSSANRGVRKEGQSGG